MFWQSQLKCLLKFAFINNIYIYNPLSMFKICISILRSIQGHLYRDTEPGQILFQIYTYFVDIRDIYDAMSPAIRQDKEKMLEQPQEEKAKVLGSYPNCTIH